MRPRYLTVSGGALVSLRKGNALSIILPNTCPLTPPPGYSEHDEQLTLEGTGIKVVTLVEIGEGDTNG